MPEQKEQRKEAPVKEGELKRISPKKGNRPDFTDEERADYWREQDPKYTT